MDDLHISLDSVELSNRARNALKREGFKYLDEILSLSEEQVSSIRCVGKKAVDEIMDLISYAKSRQRIIGKITEDTETGQEIAAKTAEIADNSGAETKALLQKVREPIVKYFKANDISIEQFDITQRTKGILIREGYSNLSDILFMDQTDFMSMQGMRYNAAVTIKKTVESYLSYCCELIQDPETGEVELFWSDSVIMDHIIRMYSDTPFIGFSFSEIKDGLSFMEGLVDDRIKKIIGKLLVARELEYVDYRCYRVYEKFSAFLESCTIINERSRGMIRKRLQGLTLEQIGNEYDVTRERVRQIVNKDYRKIRNNYLKVTGNNYFDEDYYEYFYSTYYFNRNDAEEWLGITDDICRYFDLIDVKMGTGDLDDAIGDRELDAGLRLRIKNYLNRNKLLIDGQWITRKRFDLETALVRKYCVEDLAFDDFVAAYNNYLEEAGIEFDEDIYITEEVYRTRKNRLSESRFLLWKQNEQIRYYDIDANDYTELYDTLNLASFENIELSTLKFMEEYPQIMEKFDIRNQYELHNLLRKTVPDGSYNDFHCGRMPNIYFGKFDRDAAIFDLLNDNSPISLSDVCKAIHEEFGYDERVIQATYLKPFVNYYYNGIYDVGQKKMSDQTLSELKKMLSEDFYFVDEIREIYSKAFPTEDIKEINSYNLKLMGFSVFSRYALQKYSSLEAYFEYLLTKDELLDITELRKRFGYVQSFYVKLMELKKNLTVVEYEPNQIINLKRLESFDIGVKELQDFCEEVYAWTEDNTYFTMKQIRADGFSSKLFDLGFGDWFYSNVLVSDERFSYGIMFGNLVLYKGSKNITIQSFESELIRSKGTIDIYDLQTEMSEVYGCNVDDRLDLIYKVQGTDVYYDKILERFYADIDMYYHELDEMAGM